MVDKSVYFHVLRLKNLSHQIPNAPNCVSCGSDELLVAWM